LRERGTIDKYMGDAIMAFWNAPLDVNGHAERACRCALEMAGTMSDLNEMWRVRAVAAGQPFDDIRIGIGVNTGDCCVGNLGSEQRFDYSAIGDEVNVTSRLEGLTKLYGLPAVISEATVMKSPGIDFLELDLVKVVGRTAPTRIFTPAGVLDCAPAQFARLLPLHNSFLRLYRDQNWDDAEEQLLQCRGVCIRTLDPYYALFSSRIGTLRKAPPGPSWSGAYAMTEK
jgi:adenylate cyclase